MAKANSENSFSVRYKSDVEARGKLAKYKHGITVRSRDALERRAKRACPRGYHIQGIYWQHEGSSWKMWGREEGKDFKQCWDEEACEIAFGK